MPQTLATSAVRTQPNSVRPDLAGIRAKAARVRIDPNQIEPKEMLGCIRRAMGKTGTSAKVFAINAEITESEFSEAINGKPGRRFDVEWLWKQDDAFVIAVLDEVTETRGLTPENKQAIRRARIVELIALLLQDVA